MSFEQEKMIVGSLPSLYPLQKFEEEAINALVSIPIDDDAISRKAAIELCDWYDNPSMREDLEKLRPVRFSTDCISRQAAIDLLKQMRKDGDMIPWEGKDVFARIRKLPTISIQPEIIRCKDCKHWIPYDWMFSKVWQSKNIADYPEDEIGCNYCDMAMKANDFCSRGERRTDG